MRKSRKNLRLPRRHQIVDPDQPAAAGQVGCVIVRVDDAMEPRIKRIRPRASGAVLAESLADGYPPQEIAAADLVRTCRLIDHLPAGI